MWRDRRFHSKRLPGWARNVQLTLSAFSKWCNIITWGNVLSSKWDKFIFCRAAFVPSGGEAIKLAGSVGSPARHMWHERGARCKKAWPPPKSLPQPSVRARPQKAGGHAAVEQISSNLSVLVRGLQWEGCSPAPSPPVPHVGPVYPCQHTARRMACRRGWGHGGGGAGAVGISALPWTTHVCSQQAIALPGRKYLSGEELARDRSAPPPRVLTANTDTTCIFWISVNLSFVQKMAEVQLVLAVHTKLESQTIFFVVGVVAHFNMFHIITNL